MRIENIPKGDAEFVLENAVARVQDEVYPPRVLVGHGVKTIRSWHHTSAELVIEPLKNGVINQFGTGVVFFTLIINRDGCNEAEGIERHVVQIHFEVRFGSGGCRHTHSMPSRGAQLQYFFSTKVANLNFGVCGSGVG